MIEYFLYLIVKFCGFIVRRMPYKLALRLGKIIGTLVYYFNIKHKAVAFSNLKIAFSNTKSPNEIKRIMKSSFQNYGQNLIELLRLPLFNKDNFFDYVNLQGREYIDEGLAKGKGVILLPMHFGNWELANLTCTMLSYPYKVMVKPQKKYLKLNELLNSYRSCGGSVVLSRGIGTRELIKSLQNNEVVGMVVDQGGKDGVLIPFLNREASMSSGAIRMALKMGVTVCFVIIIREKKGGHRIIIHKPLSLETTNDLENDVLVNLKKVIIQMEDYIQQYPEEYMWFYKIWKYSKDSTILILDDGKVGHLRQSQTVTQAIGEALGERSVKANVSIVKVDFKSTFWLKCFSFIAFITKAYFFIGRLAFLKHFLKEESLKRISSMKADFIISCGSSTAGLNYFLANDHQAKSIVILKPGLMSFRKFDLVILPEHDRVIKRQYDNVAITLGAPNLINSQYLTEQKNLLLNRFSHVKQSAGIKIGFLVGGDTKHFVFHEPYVKVVANQIKEAADVIGADILVTTSRRTSPQIENLLQREFKRHPRCPLLIISNRNNVPYIVGGILGLCDILIVSGDSISMVSEAASSGKDTIVFSAPTRAKVLKGFNKHKAFLKYLYRDGYIVSVDVGNIAQAILNIVKKKIQTKALNDYHTIVEAVKNII